MGGDGGGDLFSDEDVEFAGVEVIAGLDVGDEFEFAVVFREDRFFIGAADEGEFYGSVGCGEGL